jgi:D-3-phosphoglycerate dehydrogenase
MLHAMRKRVLLPSPLIHPSGEAILEAEVDVLRAAELGPDGITEVLPTVHGIYNRADAADIAAAESLEVAASGGSGVDFIDIAAATRHGVLVVNAAGAQNVSVAEHAVGLLLALVKRIAISDRMLRSGAFPERSEYRGDGWPLGFPRELHGRTLGVLGYGAIGREMARMCGAAFSMPVVAYDPFVDPATATGPAELVGSLDELLARAEVLSMHLPLSDETRGIIGAEELARLPEAAYLLNMSRGGTVDESALVDALRSGRLAGAGLDVFTEEPLAVDSPLRSLDNVVLTPHIGGWTAESLPRLAQTTAREILTVLRGERPTRLVNPEAWPAFLARRSG